VFKVNTDGSGYVVLKNFTGSDGSKPQAALTLSGNTLYGTTVEGGSSGAGTMFKVNTDGTGYTVLKTFSGSDGAEPFAGLTLSGSKLYGTTRAGGRSKYGTVFKINTNGSDYTVLKSFTGGDGANPQAGLTLSGSTLYGSTAYGGDFNEGTVFSLSLAPPRLTIASAGANVILSWSTDVTGFTLQSTTNLVSSAWSTVSPSPVVVNGQYTITNLVSGPQQFYRLTD
jgi:uncharacterized repeat protein (TIGR03803 family)